MRGPSRSFGDSDPLSWTNVALRTEQFAFRGPENTPQSLLSIISMTDSVRFKKIPLYAMLELLYKNYYFREIGVSNGGSLWWKWGFNAASASLWMGVPRFPPVPSPGDLPLDASAMGFTKSGQGPAMREPLNIYTGFRHSERYPTTWDPLYWFEKYFLEGMWPEMLNWIRRQGLGIGIDEGELRLRWRKFTLIELFMGVHCLPEEKDYFSHFRGGMSVLEFYFGNNFLSFAEFLECKKLFRAPRREFTIKFNTMMRTIYGPERYHSL